MSIAFALLTLNKTKHCIRALKMIYASKEIFESPDVKPFQ